MNKVENKDAENLKITDNWIEQFMQLKEKYPQLTDEDLKYKTQKENELFNKVEKRLNKKRKKVINSIEKQQIKS